MTDKLRDLMDERASELDFPVPDFSAVRSAGLRQRRRRRAAVASGAGAVVAAGVAVALVLGTGGSDPQAGPDVATDGPPSPPAPGQVVVGPSYAIDEVIHDGGTTIDVGHQITSYTRTSVGFVTVDDTGAVWSVADGAVEQIGVADDTHRLVSDPATSTVAWFDEQGTPTYVVHDQATGDETTYEPTSDGSIDNGQPYGLYALDGDTLYARNGDAAVAIDLATGEWTVIDPAVRDTSDVLDAAAGQVAFLGAAGRNKPVPVFGLGATRAEVRDEFQGEYADAVLSPDAAYLAFADDEGGVYDTATGDRVDLGLTGYYEAVEWYDATTVAVITGSTPDGGGSARLLACDVATGGAASCTETATGLGTFTELDDHLVLPTGERG